MISKNSVMSKPYSKGIKEDLAPYLVNVVETNEPKNKFRYVFNISCASASIITQFDNLTRNLKCWRKLSKYEIVWLTNSTFLKEMYEKRVVGGSRRSAQIDLSNPCMEIHNRETPEDIHYQGIHSLSFSVSSLDTKDKIQNGGWSNTNMLSNKDDTITFSYDYDTNNKEKEMNDKFKVVFSIDINVNGKDYKLTDPIKSEDALPVILQLGKRAKVLNERKELLVDAVENLGSISSVTEVLDNELEELQELLKHINDNIEDID